MSNVVANKMKAGDLELKEKVVSISSHFLGEIIARYFDSSLIDVTG